MARNKKKEIAALSSEQKNKLFELLNRSFVISDFKVALHLPREQNVKGAESLVSWEDPDGVTYGQNEAEEEAIKEWLAAYIGKKIGYPITIIALLNGSDTKCHAYFRRTTPKVDPFRRP